MQDFTDRWAVGQPQPPPNAQDSSPADTMALVAAQAALDLIDEAVIIADAEGHLLAWSHPAEQLVGHGGVALEGMTIDDLLEEMPNSNSHKFQMYGDLPSGTWTGDLVLRSADGARHAVTVRRQLVRSPSTDQLRQVLVLSGGVPGIERRGTVDQLTGLPYREFLREHYVVEQRKAARNGRRIALLWIDVDRFKVINDWVGHRGGDLFLRHVADSIARAIGGSGLLCRVASNEFLAVITDVDTARLVSELVERIRDALSVGFVLNGDTLHRTVSIGVSLYPDDGADFEELARKADIAKRLARRGGQNQVLFHTGPMMQDIEQRQDLERILASAIERNEIFLRYQPQIDLLTGRIVGLEALARWTRPDHGEIPPGVFIPIAEGSGVIVDLAAKVYRLACAQASAWNRAGIAVPISVNMSPVEIRLGDADVRILEIIEQSGLPPELLAVEITESGLVDETTRTEVVITNLRESSVSLIIDDFLTGYSNFAYIRRFRASHLKIDRSFVAGIDDNSENVAIVRAVVQMATALGIVTVAEGVETEREATALQALGCGCAQGYLYARPMLPEELEPLLRHGVISPSLRSDN